MSWNKDCAKTAHAEEWTARHHAVDVRDAATGLSLQTARVSDRTLKVRVMEGGAAQERSAHCVEKHSR